MGLNINYTILVDNFTDCSGLKAEHGLSIVCRIDNNKLLIDTGAGEALFFNAAKLGINLEEIESVILTHGHNDHVGGLLQFLHINKKAKIFITPQAIYDKHFLKTNDEYLNIGADNKIIEKYEDRLKFVNSDMSIHGSIKLLLVNCKNYPVYSTNNMLYVKQNNLFQKDDFNHELMIVIDNSEYIDVITGCSHSGIINMVNTVQHKYQKRIRYLFGGFHTGDIPKYGVSGITDEDLEQLANFFRSSDIEKIYTMHCTGQTHYEKLKRILGDQIDYSCAGTII